MSTDKDLIERLLDLTRYLDGEERQEAAARLTSLSEEVERLKEALETLAEAPNQSHRGCVEQWSGRQSKWMISAALAPLSPSPLER